MIRKIIDFLDVGIFKKTPVAHDAHLTTEEWFNNDSSWKYCKNVYILHKF